MSLVKPGQSYSFSKYAALNFFAALFIIFSYFAAVYAQTNSLTIVTAGAAKDSNGNLTIDWSTSAATLLKGKIAFWSSDFPNTQDKVVQETSAPSGTDHRITVNAAEVPANYIKIRISYDITEETGTYKDILKSEIAGGTQKIDLKPGFNFIAFTIKPSLSPMQLKTAHTFIEEIYSFNAASGSFLTASEGSLTTLNAGRGYIVKSTLTVTINIDGSDISAIGDTSLKFGFNLLGISKPFTFLKFSELMTQKTLVKGIYKYNTGSGSFLQVIRNNSGEIEFTDGVDPAFSQGQSYFINMAGDDVLNYDKLPAPSILPGGGKFTASQQITITCATSDAIIKYTTDGSTPSETSGNVYAGPFTLSSTATVKAVAIKTGAANSVIVSALFEIGASSNSSNKIAFGSNRDGKNFQVYSMNEDGSGLTRITNNSFNDYEPVFSVDRGKIVFSSDRDGSYEIYIMNSDGSAQTRLTNSNNKSNNHSPAISPDGSRIVFYKTNPDIPPSIYLMNANGSGLLYIAEGVDPSFSPDGTRIIYNSGADIYGSGLDGSGKNKIVSNQKVYGGPKYSPDGSKIVYFADAAQSPFSTEIYIFDVISGTPSRLTNNNTYIDGMPLFSSDGTKIFFETDRDNNFEIYSMSIDGSKQTNLTNNPAEDQFSQGRGFATVAAILPPPAIFPFDNRTFTDNIQITILGVSKQVIYYTTDGSNPSASSALYTAPFTISETTTIKAIAINGGTEISSISSATFTKITSARMSRERIRSEISE